MRVWHKRLIIAVIVLTAILFSRSSWSAFVELNEDDIIIVELYLSRFRLSDAMMAYQHADATFISMEEFVDAMDYAIDVDSEAGVASGWYISQENSFDLNIAKNEVYLRGVKQELPSNFLYSSDDFGLYIDIRHIEKWFNLRITFHMSRLQIRIEADEPQPVEQRLIREKRRGKKENVKNRQNKYPILEDKYLWVGPVGLDLQLITRHGTEGGANGFSLQTSGDILLHQSRLSHTHTDLNEASSTRLSFYRDAAKPGDDIALGVSHYSFGDIYSQGDSLVNSGASGVGFLLNSQVSQSLDDSFSRRDFEGDAPPGWEVELYRNGLFVDFVLIDQSGQYIFENIGLQYGENLFEVRLFGPQGQKRVKKERVQIGTDLIQPGQWQFSMTGLNEKEVLIGQSGSATNRPLNNKNVSLSAHYGVFDQHSFGAGYNFLAPSATTEERNYTRLIWISSYSTFSSRVEFAKDMGHVGHAVNFNITGRFFNQDVSYEHQLFNDFISTKSNLGNTLQKVGLNFFGNVGWGQTQSVPYSLGLFLDETVKGDKRYRLENTIGFTYGPSRFSNKINMSASNQDSNERISGVLTINRVVDNYQLRGGINYDISELEVPSISFTADANTPPWTYQLQGTGSFLDQGVSVLELNISRTIDDMSISLVGQIDTDKKSSVGLTFSALFIVPATLIKNQSY